MPTFAVCLFVCLFVCLLACLLACLLSCLFVCLFVCLFQGVGCSSLKCVGFVQRVKKYKYPNLWSWGLCFCHIQHTQGCLLSLPTLPSNKRIPSWWLVLSSKATHEKKVFWKKCRETNIDRWWRKHTTNKWIGLKMIFSHIFLLWLWQSGFPYISVTFLSAASENKKSLGHTKLNDFPLENWRLDTQKTTPFSEGEDTHSKPSY